MNLKASDERDNEDFDDLKLELTPSGKDLTVKLTLTNGNEIEFILNNVGKKEIIEEYWFSRPAPMGTALFTTRTGRPPVRRNTFSGIW